jgi:hypothetical protein
VAEPLDTHGDSLIHGIAEKGATLRTRHVRIISVGTALAESKRNAEDHVEKRMEWWRAGVGGELGGDAWAEDLD